MPARQLRVALDGTPLTVPTGGVRRYVEELSAALRQTFPEDEYRLVSDQLSQPRSPVDRRWWLIGLRRELDRLGSDLFHGTDFAVPYLSPRPSVMTLHDLSPWRADTRRAASRRVRCRTPWLLRLGMATMVIAPSEAVRAEAISRFRLSPAQVVSVPMAASVLFRPVLPPSTARPYFLYVGTIESRKNVGIIIDAWRQLGSNNVDLWIAGRVRDPIDLKGARHLDSVPDQELPGLYSGAVAVLYPSLYEGFGLPVLEAMQCGAMVIASKDAAITELAGGAALLADARDLRQWIEAMGLALTSETYRKGWQECGLRRAAEFSWVRTARMTREVYVEALRRG
jgi:glycosyltransferase involved in cell wall biosynthesis